VSTEGGYIHGWTGGAFHANVEHGKLWLGLSGRYCGQQNPSSRAAAQACERALSWSRAKGKLYIDPNIKPRPVSFQ
ncbi:hypothetical protein U5801_29015, partial [Lamprobacter modestohalophilus]|uniref:hypothetical protein n=1 Tax=Lamprobacter modestohalophilus TaxID=1064514 RepID=UPI002ADEC95A